MSEYEYRDENGKLLFTKVKLGLPCCPECGSKKTKDKGSFSKCLDCGERFEDSITVYPEGQSDA